MKTTNYILLGAAAVGAWLLAKANKAVSGIGATQWEYAKWELDRAGIDLNQDFFVLGSWDVSKVVEIMKRAGYRPSKNAPGSPARMFWYAMQRKFGY